MNNLSNSKLNKKATPPQALVSANTPQAPKVTTIKIGIDVHLDRHVAVRIIDGNSPQPPQSFKPEEFLLWMAKQLKGVRDD